jgi:hypothetical protein
MHNAVPLMPRSMRLAALMLTMTWSLAAVPSDAHAMGANPTQFVAQPQCPPLKRYTAPQSKQLGTERKKLRAAGGYPMMLETSDDYLLLRDQCRAIEAKP